MALRFVKKRGELEGVEAALGRRLIHALLLSGTALL